MDLRHTFESLVFKYPVLQEEQVMSVVDSVVAEWVLQLEIASKQAKESPLTK